MAGKEFKTIEQQIKILQERGLNIPDTTKAKQFLFRNNYYRISGYSLTLRNHNDFAKSASFQNIIDIYTFDHELRHILLKYIEEIEITVKSIYAYEFTKVHGATGYLDSENFTDLERYQKTINKAEQQKITRLPHEAFLKHFVEDLHEDIPLWAYVDLLTISDISFLYSISKLQVKTAVATAMGIHKQGERLLGQFMHSMTIIRNLCAHGSRLFNRLFEQKPSLSKKEKQLLIVNKDQTLDNAHLFGYILIMRRLLLTESFDTMKSEIITLSDKYPFVKMSYYGFRDDWKTTL